MNVADRAKQTATATSDAVYVLAGGVADTDCRLFADAFHFPTTGDLAGDVDYNDVPIFVKPAAGGWQVITATVRRSSAGVVSILNGVVRESSTGSALGLTGSAAVTVAVVPSYWADNLAAFGSRTHATTTERYVQRPTVSNSGLAAFGPRSSASHEHAIAQGYNAYTSLPYERVQGNGNWTEAGGGVLFKSDIIWQAKTSNATPEVLACYDATGLITGSGAVFADAIALYVLKGTLTAIKTGGGDKKVWDVLVAIFSDGSTPATVGTATFTEVYESAGSTGWTPAMAYTNAPDTFSLQVTGQAATDITWGFTGTLHQHVDYN